jgi:hypothetical protein
LRVGRTADSWLLKRKKLGEKGSVLNLEKQINTGATGKGGKQEEGKRENRRKGEQERERRGEGNGREGERKRREKGSELEV